MMTFPPKDELKPDDDGKKKGPSTNRIMVWIVVGGIGLYMLGFGIYDLLTR